MTGKIIIQDLYVRNPPAWYQRIGNGPWKPINLDIYGGRLPVVWLKPVDWVVEETWMPEEDFCPDCGRDLKALGKYSDFIHYRADTPGNVPCLEEE